MPRQTKRALAALKREAKKDTPGIYLSCDDDSSSSSSSSPSSSSEEDFTKFQAKFAKAQSEWVTAETKFRAVYTGTSRRSMYRKKQRDTDRAKSMKNSPNLLHYFKKNAAEESELISSLFSEIQ